MKNIIIPVFVGAFLSILLISCGNSYEKSPEDWSKEICETAAEHGADSQEVKDKITELKKYYDDDDYRMHDKATTLVGQSCPEVVLAQ
ncbi:MAG: hypothetical protein ACFHU9_05080 [Fluviicola sp.]